jgi:rare lipoprotein A (peptidoglycan hydrolase)
LASWYGDQFQDKQKASGEKFDKMSMTAAHKTLPIPSVVRVTNPRNGRSVILVVDDRGPFFYKGRIIDLSYAAAKALDMHKCKPSPVRVQTLVEDSLKLSIYIKHHCKKRKDPMGRTWNQIYMQEIRGGRSEFYMTQTDFGGDANGFSSSAVREYKQTDTQKKSKKQISSLKSDQKTKSEVTANKTVSSQRNKYKNATKKRYNGLGRYIGKL